MNLTAIRGRKNYVENINRIKVNPQIEYLSIIVLEMQREKCKIILKCPICIENIEYKENLYITYCFHKFHKECIERWLYIKKNCPICRYHLY